MYISMHYEIFKFEGHMKVYHRERYKMAFLYYVYTYNLVIGYIRLSMPHHKRGVPVFPLIIDMECLTNF